MCTQGCQLGNTPNDHTSLWSQAGLQAWPDAPGPLRIAPGAGDIHASWNQGASGGMKKGGVQPGASPEGCPRVGLYTFAEPAALTRSCAERLRGRSGRAARCTTGPRESATSRLRPWEEQAVSASLECHGQLSSVKTQACADAQRRQRQQCALQCRESYGRQPHQSVSPRANGGDHTADSSCKVMLAGRTHCACAGRRMGA